MARNEQGTQRPTISLLVVSLSLIRFGDLAGACDAARQSLSESSVAATMIAAPAATPATTKGVETGRVQPLQG